MPDADDNRPSEAVTFWRGSLIAAGVLLLAIGGLTFLTDVSADQYPGVVAWLGGAIILHDAIAAMAVFGVTVLARRAARVVPFVVLAILQAAVAVAVIVTVLVLPEIVKDAIGTANPSVLPLDYLQNLIVFYVGLAALTSLVLIVALGVMVRSRRDPRVTEVARCPRESDG
jgi:hypothetical protein